MEISQIGTRHGLAMLLPLKKPFRAQDFHSRLTATGNNALSGELPELARRAT